MRTLDLVFAFILALIAFVVIKSIGMMVQFAFIAALLGLAAGLGLGRVLRRVG
jgi:hypothetical protein